MSMYMKRCLTPSIIREIEVKATMRYHLTCVRMAVSAKRRDNKYWQESGEKGTLVHYWECAE